MRYIKYHLETITGVEIYPLISLLIFFLFFAGLLIYVFTVDKRFLTYMGERPLDKEDQHETQS